MVATVIEVNGKSAAKSSKWSIYILYNAQNYCSVMRSLKIYLRQLDSMLAKETVISYNRFVMGLTSFSVFISNQYDGIENMFVHFLVEAYYKSFWLWWKLGLAAMGSFSERDLRVILQRSWIWVDDRILNWKAWNVK